MCVFYIRDINITTFTSTTTLSFCAASLFPSIISSLAKSPVALLREKGLEILVREFFTGYVPFLSPDQQCERTEGIKSNTYIEDGFYQLSYHSSHMF